uniref:HCF101 n=1 Tax=Arundo donax TaxID=35708 RepID=A0A0A9GUB9_ARUDO
MPRPPPSSRRPLRISFPQPHWLQEPLCQQRLLLLPRPPPARAHGSPRRRARASASGARGLLRPVLARQWPRWMMPRRMCSLRSLRSSILISARTSYPVGLSRIWRSMRPWKRSHFVWS